MKKLILPIILLFAILLIKTSNAELVNQPCASGQYCDGYSAENGQCFGTCKSLEENPCNQPWYDLGSNLECKLFSGMNSLIGIGSKKASDFVSGLVSPNINPKGNEKLYAFSYSISLTLALLLLITTAILYISEVFKDTSSVELLDNYRSQIFKFFIMMALLFSSYQLISLFIGAINELNTSIITSMITGGDIASAMIATILAGAGVIILLIAASLGTGLVMTVLLFISFFIVLLIKGIILYVLLSIVPIMIVLYFFDFTRKAGDRLFKLLLAHLLISTVWITVFAIAFDFPNQFSPINPMYALSSALAPIVAAIINSMLYFKVVTFFGSYESTILSKAHPISHIIERRHEIIKSIQKKIGRSPQAKLTGYLK